MLFGYKQIEGENISLIPFNDHHIEGLKKIAFDERIWQNLPYKIYSGESFDDYIELVNERIEKKQHYFWTIFDKNSNKILGMTGYLSIDEINRKLEIGGTWMTPNVWGTKINLEAKYLLLKYCFEANNIERVEIKTREANIRSQKAIEKIGGQKEGVLRHDRINDDGTFRNTFLYSIIRTDWEELREKLIKALQTEK